MASETATPSIKTFQFDNDALGDIGSSVNLFRGDVNLPLTLVSLPGQNGLDLEVKALYQSNVHRAMSTWNLEAPTGVLGLGWSLPLEQITYTPRASAAVNDRRYVLHTGGGAFELVATDAAWQLAKLAPAERSELAAGRVGPGVRKRLAGAGIDLDATAEVSARPGGWQVLDRRGRRQLRVADEGSGATVYAGGEAYEVASYQFWRIHYLPALESWEVVKEDGVRYLFGGLTEPDTGVDPLAIEWGIRWGNWVGASNVAAGQERYARAWNLSRVIDAWGDFLAFRYRQDQQRVGTGTLTFTRSTTFQEIRNNLGRRVVFHYLPKVYNASAPEAAKEFLDPHRDAGSDPRNAPPNAYQDRYETDYLARIGVYSGASDDELLFELHCDYGAQGDERDLVNLTRLEADNPLAYGATYKRYLRGIRQVMAGPRQQSLPGMSFEYDWTGPDAADAERRNRGGLTAVTYPQGGRAIYSYDRLEAGGAQLDGAGSRLRTVANPFAPKAATPRVWFSAGYVLVAWFEPTAGELRLEIYNWLGRWVRSVDPQPIRGNLDLGRLQVITAPDSFALSYRDIASQQSHVYLWHRDDRRSATWLPAEHHQLDSPDVALAGGDGFVLVHDQQAPQKLYRYSWDWQSASWAGGQLQPETPLCAPQAQSTTYYLATGADFYAVLCYPYGGDTPSRLSLSYRDAQGVWHQGQPLDFNLYIDTWASLVVGDSCAALAHWVNSSASLGTFDYQLERFQWNADFSGLRRLTDGRTFTDIPQNKLGAIMPQLVDNSLIASGPYLWRYDARSGDDGWTFQELDIELSRDADTYQWFAAGPDAVLYSKNAAGGREAILAGFDADRGQWYQQQVQAPAPPYPDLRFERDFPTAQATCLSYDTTLYLHAPGPRWPDPLSATGTLAAGAAGRSVDTTTVVNQGPNFVAYMVVDDGTSRPVRTDVCFPRNGGLRRGDSGAVEVQSFAQQMFSTMGTDGYPQPDLNGKRPAIATGFVTFPLDESFDQASALTLHRYADASVEGPLVSWPVVELRVASGTQTVHTVYRYDDASAALNASGTVARFHRVTVLNTGATAATAAPAGGSTVNTFFNGQPQDALPEAEADQLLLDGNPIRSEVFDSAGQLVASSETTWAVLTEVRDLSTGQPRPVRGGYARTLATASTQDGVTRREDTTYDPATGQAASRQSSYYGSDGALVTERETLRYGVGIDEYEMLRARHMLSVQVESRSEARRGTSGAYTLLAASAQVLAEQPSRGEAGQTPAVVVSYSARHASAGSFTAWDPAQPPGSADWLATETVVERDQAGNPLLVRDVAGMPTTTLYDQGQLLAVAAFANASSETDALAYTGFESYEGSSGWSYQASGSSTSGVIETDAHTGRACFQCAEPGALVRWATIATTPRDYVAGTWIKVPADFVARGGSLSWRLSFYDQVNGTPLAGWPQLEVDLEPAADGAWSNRQAVLGVAQVLAERGAGRASVAIQLELVASWPGSAQLWARLDDLCLHPADSPFSATVYHLPRLLVTASVGASGETAHTLYDAFSRQVASIGPDRRVDQLQEACFARQLQPVIDASHPFPIATPNSALTLAGLGHGLYDPFLPGSEAAWELPAGWSVGDRQLRFSGSSSDPLGSRARHRAFTASDYAARLEVVEAAGRVSLGNGQACVLWDPNASASQRWQLLAREGQSWQTVATSAGDFATSWCLTFAAGRVLFTADGIQRFSRYIAKLAGVAGGLEIGMSAAGAVTQLAVVEAPQVALDFADGASRGLQSVRLAEGDTALVSAQVYDVLGREAIVTKTVRLRDSDVASGNVLAYAPELVTNGGASSSLWQGGELQGLAATLLPEDQGYPFARKVFEPSPLGRVLVQGAPGKAFAILPGNANAHVIRTHYGSNTGSEGLHATLPAGQYFVTTTVDQNGITTRTVTDQKDQTLGSLISPVGTASRTVRSSSQYDLAGNAVATYPPNYYQQGNNSAFVATASYDFLNLQRSSHTPDSGEGRALYDLAGRKRFSQDQEARDGGYLSYFLYDAQGRPTEQGSLDFDWTPETEPYLQQQADENPTWPAAEPGARWQSRLAYDGAGTEEGPADLSHRLGRMWRVTSLTGTQEVTETFRYDARGQIAEVTQSLRDTTTPAGAPWSGTLTDRVAYTYNTAGSVTHLAVQPEDGSGHAGFETAYDFDLLGQMQRVYDPRSGHTYAEYRYNPGGNPERVDLAPASGPLAARTLLYNSPQWPVLLDDTRLAETLTYTSGGAGDRGYYNGEIASRRMDYRTLAQAHTGRFGLDGLNRLEQLHAESENPAAQAEVAYTYDDNDNLRTRQETGGTLQSFVPVPNTNCLQQVTTPDGSFTRQLEYTAAGNVRRLTGNDRPELTFSYDRTTRLTTRIELPATQRSASYAYGGNQQRVLKLTGPSQGAAEQALLYVHGNNAYPVLETTWAGGSVARRRYFVYGAAGMVAMQQDESRYYLLKDHEGSTRMVLDEAGTTVAAYDYSPWGLPRVLADEGLGFTYLYTGQEYEADLELYNYRARFYAPGLGCFLAVDPKGQFASPYVYVGDQPLDAIDPNGEFAFLIAAALIGAGLGMVGGGLAAYANGADGAGEWAAYLIGGAALGAVSGLLTAGVGAAAAAAASAASLGAVGTGIAGISGSILGGAAAGSLQGVGMAGIANGVSDANINVGQEAWMGAVVGAVGGAIGGAIGGSGLGNLAKLAPQGSALRTGLGAAFTVAGGTLAGAGSSTTNALLRDKPWNQVLVSAATGAVFGGLAAGVGAGTQYKARQSPAPRAPGLTAQSLAPASSLAGIPAVLRAHLYQQSWQAFWYGTAQQAPPFIVANQINGAIKAGDPNW